MSAPTILCLGICATEMHKEVLKHINRNVDGSIIHNSSKLEISTFSTLEWILHHVMLATNMSNLLLHATLWMTVWGSPGEEEVSMFGKGCKESLCVAGHDFFLDLRGDYMVMFTV